jgi:FMN phosphatase YigB (HAD superfamily)
MAQPHDLVILFDVDNTLIDNDGVQADLRRHLAENYGAAARDQYWGYLEEIRGKLGFVDYLGALERYRDDQQHDPRVLRIGSWLLDYPFANRVYPGAVDAVREARRAGLPVILSDGDAVFQPRKVERSGLWNEFAGNVLIYIHKEKELADVERWHPAQRYALIDDKLRILTAVKHIWRDRVTTVFVRQGHYARDPAALAAYPAADLTIDNIGDLPLLDLTAIVASSGG